MRDARLTEGGITSGTNCLTVAQRCPDEQLPLESALLLYTQHSFPSSTGMASSLWSSVSLSRVRRHCFTSSQEKSYGDMLWGSHSLMHTVTVMTAIHYKDKGIDESWGQTSTEQTVIFFHGVRKSASDNMHALLHLSKLTQSLCPETFLRLGK